MVVAHPNLMTTVLIVDDTPGDRAAVRRVLERGPYTLVEVESGEDALARAEQELPELVVLDIVLPGIHGFEVARRLKALAGDRSLPILIVSGLADPTSRALAANLGVDGFLTKPVDGALLAAVENLLARNAEKAAMAAKNAELREHARLREELSALIVHDIKSPLSAVLAGLEYAQDVAPPVEDLRESLHDARAAAQRIARLLGNLLDVARSEANALSLRLEPVDPHEVLAEIARRTGPLLRNSKLRLDLVSGAAGVVVQADRDVLTRVVENVLDNALRYAPRGGRIELATRLDGGSLQLRIGNNGPPIPEERRVMVFEKFGSTKDGRANLGLGMYFCRLACEAHGGRIWIDSEPELGTVFVIELPRPTP